MAKKKTNGDTLPLELLAIQSIQNFKAPKTTQDAVDQIAAELAVASLLRTQADKRYDAVKRRILADYDQQISALLEQASDTMTKSSTLLHGEDWLISLNANKPALKCDVDELRTELVRMGVKIDIIDKAVKRVTKKAKPALILNAAPLTD
jgi:uncharacterized protein YhaN